MEGRARRQSPRPQVHHRPLDSTNADHDAATSFAARHAIAPMDSQDLIDMNRRLAASKQLGASPLIEIPGDHFSVINPQHEILSNDEPR